MSEKIKALPGDLIFLSSLDINEEKYTRILLLISVFNNFTSKVLDNFELSYDTNECDKRLELTDIYFLTASGFYDFSTLNEANYFVMRHGEIIVGNTSYVI